jgi:hypothetical protein
MPMEEVCTLNDLVAYLYNETELTESVMVQNAIDHNYEVAETYQDLISAKALLDTTLLRPSDGVVQRLLNYSLTH